MERDPFYLGIIGLARALFAFEGLKFTITGQENVPKKGGAVIAINHTGYMDFTYAGIPFRSQRRFVRYMAKREIFDHKIAGPLMRAMKHIPVDRIDGQAAYDAAVDYLRRGMLVGVFPESTISRSFEIKTLRSGAVRMAVEAGVPVIPVIIVGSQRVWTKGFPKRLGRTKLPIHIHVDAPWYPSKDPEFATAQLRDRMEGILHRVWDEYAAAHGPLPEGAFWVPARLGGGAPTLEEAQKADDAVAEERHRIRVLRDDLTDLSASVLATSRELFAKAGAVVGRASGGTSADGTRGNVAGAEAAGATSTSADASTAGGASVGDPSTDAISAAPAGTAGAGSPTAGVDSMGAEDVPDPEAVLASVRSTFDSLLAEVIDTTKEGASKIADARDELKKAYPELVSAVQQRLAKIKAQQEAKEAKKAEADASKAAEGSNSGNRAATSTDGAGAHTPTGPVEPRNYAPVPDGEQLQEWRSLDQAMIVLLSQAKQIRDRIPARMARMLPDTVTGVCTDLDGTVLPRSKRMSPATIDAFSAMMDRGVPVMICTGRPIEELAPVVAQLPFRPKIVCANGAVVVDSGALDVPAGAPVEELHSAFENLLSASDLAGKPSEPPANPPAAVMHVDQFPAEDVEVIENAIRKAIPEVKFRSRAVTGGVVKILVMAEMTGADMAAKIEAALAEASAERAQARGENLDASAAPAPLAHVTYSTPYGYVELAPVGVTKASGLAWLLDHEDIDPAGCVAFGDMPNDREMLDYVGTGVTMGNAHWELIRESSFVTSSVENDGVAHVLYQLLDQLEDE